MSLISRGPSVYAAVQPALMADVCHPPGLGEEREKSGEVTQRHGEETTRD